MKFFKVFTEFLNLHGGGVLFFGGSITHTEKMFFFKWKWYAILQYI
jgi:hypothetical protein